MKNARTVSHRLTLLSSVVLLAGCGGTDSTPKTALGDTASQAEKTPARTGASVVLDADTEYDKAAALAADGKLDEAQIVFQAAARLDPQHSSIAAALEMYRDVGEGRASREVIQRMHRAMQHANASRWSDAHADADAAVKLAPSYVRAHDTRAKLFLFQGKYAAAINAFNQGLAIDAKFAEGYYNRGATYYEMGRYDDAIADYTRAIELRPSFSEAYRNRGSAYTFKNNSQAAMDDYTKAHELYPSAVEPLYLRGVLFALQGQWNEATADYTRAIERDSTHAQSYYDRGLAYQNRGNDERALADYTKAIELNPDNPAALVNRGLLAMRRKQYDRAIDDFDKTLSIAPAMVIAQYNKALALDQTGRAAETVAAYKKFLQQATPEHAALANHARERLAALEK